MNQYGYRGRQGIDPAVAGIALLATALPILGLALNNPKFTHAPEQIIQLYPVNVPEVPPPDPEPIEQPKLDARPSEPVNERIVISQPEVPTEADTGPVISTTLTPPPVPPAGPIGNGSGAGSATATPTPPVLVNPRPDPRYMARFQPDYPLSERRANREGIVVVRVLVGVTGRVKAVEQVSATSDAFYRATREQALSAWRFEPATRDGVPVERWYQTRVRFQLH